MAGPEDDIRRWCGGTPRALLTVPGITGLLRVEIGFIDATTLTLGGTA
ncbi:hypothetical protein H0H10_01515 [Streptomyces sp. TRM S81-3]|uniref:Uncharacterized protein n=1 Tax=Streptomyces griseicoloratus TaxID=2752516 RepID=A0A926KW03_9ACTN|nr:hypothetical protein [Streptomyces griseicoloratus]MBD0417870.1 hypothetical protein [Streptomyces griseicoloratus]